VVLEPIRPYLVSFYLTPIINPTPRPRSQRSEQLLLLVQHVIPFVVTRVIIFLECLCWFECISPRIPACSHPLERGVPEAFHSPLRWIRIWSVWYPWDVLWSLRLLLVISNWFLCRSSPPLAFGHWFPLRLGVKLVGSWLRSYLGGRYVLHLEVGPVDHLQVLHGLVVELSLRLLVGLYQMVYQILETRKCRNLWVLWVGIADYIVSMVIRVQPLLAVAVGPIPQELCLLLSPSWESLLLIGSPFFHEPFFLALRPIFNYLKEVLREPLHYFLYLLYFQFEHLILLDQASHFFLQVLYLGLVQVGLRNLLSFNFLPALGQQLP